METSNSNYKKLKLVTKVKIMNFPSKDMIIHLLNNFLSENKLQKDYVILERSLFLLIKFKDSDTAFSFVKRLNYEKLINHYYSSIEVTMNIDIYKKKEKNIGKSVSLPRLFNKNSKTENTNHTIEISKYYKPSIKKKTNLNFAFTSILASTPYLDPYEEQKKKNKENKFRWISKKNFNGYFSRATSNKNIFYHDYISEGMPALPISFRPVEKNKWMSKKNFLVC